VNRAACALGVHGGDSGHARCAVDQGNAFLVPEGEWLEPSGGQCRRRRQAHALIPHLAFADEGERHVGQRGEVTAGTYRAHLRHHRYEVEIEAVEQALKQRRANSREAAGQACRARGDHGPCVARRERLAHAAAKVVDEMPLQEFGVLRRNGM